MPRRRTEDKRRRILQAAVKVFARKGYFGARVADVARRAGVADGTIYLYFRNKEHILVSLFDEVMAEHVLKARRELAAVEGAPARLQKIAEHHLRLLGGDRDLAVVFQVELRQSTKFMERFSSTQLREYLGIIRDVIAEGQTRGIFRRGVNPTFAAKVFFGALDEMATNWILSRRKYALAGETDAIVDLFVGGVGAASLRH
jgi:TetR/AcrR family fatty acid metabolism transcriptional regulator